MENVHLPHELKVAVLAWLDKRDLKAVRLVSREWSALATSPLFDKVYVSCRATDLEVFRNITRHPVISAGVRELVYDGSFFIKNLSFSGYFDQVFVAVRLLALHADSDIHIESADVQINDFCRDCQTRDPDVSEIYGSHGKDTFLVEGYQIYREFSAFEWQGIECGWFFEELSTGLGSLKGLRSVVLDHGFWELNFFKMLKPNRCDALFSGSPLSRIWNPFHLGPAGWQSLMLSDLDTVRPRIAAQFHMLTRAIRETNKEISSLQILDYDGCIPHQALTVSTLTNTDVGHFMTAYSGLRCLDIKIAADSADHQDALIVLPDLLRQTYGLERLSLHFSRDVVLLPLVPRYCYKEVFPTLGSWPALKELSLFGLEIGGWELLILVLRQVRLRRLELGDIELLDGTWEGVIEGLRRLPGVSELHMSIKLTHRRGTVFSPDGPFPFMKGFIQRGLLRRIESYIVCGGRHPCLTPESDPDTALRWLRDLMPEDQLEKMKLCAREQGLYSEDLFCKCTRSHLPLWYLISPNFSSRLAILSIGGAWRTNSSRLWQDMVGAVKAPVAACEASKVRSKLTVVHGRSSQYSASTNMRAGTTEHVSGS